ncbi:hypothetical protein IQ260_30190 [Leptolyngbya cf. ectocarpi LEGE 11479]|uniref:Uncharacterized protein n=1 Tax=Leptolyngbya cf. ectocarpi LEGE 11479 TaxID=1828722 RepID=A0A929FB63_LEPEC|nr:hypothetical protein [Leptolyngbya ectocarpi]MBE9070910.1 hypothetical protein [Leptolyngbya cf. ectocarpi LEGE 11479]
MKNAVDNITLIKQFLKGEESLLANRELRLEKALDEIQLLTNQGILLAKGRFSASVPNVVVRLKSDYWALINQLALESHFIPFQIAQARLEKATFAQYDRHSVPDGYQIHCQEASAFWKAWWINHRKLQLMDMLLLCHKRWYPVNQMLCDTGTIYVKTWRGEHVLSLADTVVWLDRNTHEQRRQLKRHHDPEKLAAVPMNHPNHASAAPSDQPMVPADLRPVIKAGKNKLLVHTVLGPVVIEGQNLTCSLARKAAKVS